MYWQQIEGKVTFFLEVICDNFNRPIMWECPDEMTEMYMCVYLFKRADSALRLVVRKHCCPTGIDRDTVDIPRVHHKEPVSF